MYMFHCWYLEKRNFHSNILCISRLPFLLPFDNCNKMMYNYFQLVLVLVLTPQFHKYAPLLEVESNCLGKMFHLDNRWQQMHNFLSLDLFENMDHQGLDTMKSHLCQAKLKGSLLFSNSGNLDISHHLDCWN